MNQSNPELCALLNDTIYAGFSSDLWYLWVKTEDLVEYNRRIKLGLPLKDPKPIKPPRPKDVRLKKGIEIVRMKDEEGKPWNEIADVIGNSIETVMNYYYRHKRGEFYKDG